MAPQDKPNQDGWLKRLFGPPASGRPYPSITVFRQNGGTVEEAQHIANHASPKATMLYDRSRDQITLDDVKRIII